MQTMLRRTVERTGREAVVVASERSDGDVHLHRAGAATLELRQRRLTGRRWAMVDQTHGTAVYRVARAALGHEAATMAGRAHADVIVAADPKVPIAVWAADCAPVVLIGERGTAVAVHAGWRGLAAGIIDGAVGELGASGEAAVAAVLGPVIHACCYSFGVDELALVAAGVGAAVQDIESRTHDGRRALDVPAAVAAALGRHGIELDAVGSCTSCDERWFSHRRGDAARHALVTWSEPAGTADDDR